MIQKTFIDCQDHNIPRLAPKMEGQPGPDIIEDELSVGKEEMLYALNSTLEALEDESILQEEYYVRFDTPCFQHQSGCQRQPNPHDVELLKWKVRSTFEAVEYGHLKEDDFYFVLITPYFYYRSGNYNKLENLQSTLQALVDTYNDESGNELLQEHIVSTFEEWIASSNSESENKLLQEHIGSTIEEWFASSNSEEYIVAALEEWIASSNSEIIIVLNANEFENEIPKVEKFKHDSVRSMHKHLDFVDVGSATDEQSDKGSFQILLGIITYLLKIQQLSVSKKNLENCIACSYDLRRSAAGKRIQPSIKEQLNNRAGFFLLWLFALSTRSAKAAHQETPLTLKAGSNGVIPFNCSFSDPLDMSNVFYTLRFEAKDRPFCVDGDFDQEGFISPDQSERFSTKLNINIDTLAVNINIAFVSIEDEGTYELQAMYFFGSKDIKSQVMKKIVKVYVPPSPARCYFNQNADYGDMRSLRCHCRPGNGNSTLSCFQNGEKVPYTHVGPNEVVTSRTFWVIKETTPVVCCSHELGEEVTADSCGQQFRFPHHRVKTTVPPRTKSKEGPVAEGFSNSTNENMLPISTEQPLGSGYAMLGSILFSTLLPLLAFLTCK